MSKKQRSTSSSTDEQTTKGSDCELMQAVFQHEDNTKRAKLVPLSDTTLQDLPVEVIECILVKAVAMEVKAMKLAKSVWKEKADLVISRLRTVSTQWSSILSTNFFRNELHRTLDGYDQETIRWEILHQPSIQSFILKLAALRDEVFIVCRPRNLGNTGGYVVNVYDRNNVVEPKDVIPLPEIFPADMAACSVSNCVYILDTESRDPSVVRITKDEHQSRLSLWIKNLRLPILSHMGSISVAANGSLIILSRQRSPEPTLVGIYDASGFMRHKIRLSPEFYGIRYVGRVIQRSNGNLVLVSGNAPQFEAKLLEIDTSGVIIHEYQSSLSYRAGGVTCFEDIYGRIFINYPCRRIELLDTEFNLLDIAELRLDEGQIFFPFEMYYDRDRHEMMGSKYDSNTKISAFVTFRLTEE